MSERMLLVDWMAIKTALEDNRNKIEGIGVTIEESGFYEALQIELADLIWNTLISRGEGDG